MNFETQFDFDHPLNNLVRDGFLNLGGAGDYLGEGWVIPVGTTSTMNKPSAENRKHKQSPFYGAFPVTKEPSVLTETDPRITDLEKSTAIGYTATGKPNLLVGQTNLYQQPDVQLSEEDLDLLIEIAQQISQRYKAVLYQEDISVSTWDQAVKGIPGTDFKSMNLASSNGIPYTSLGYPDGYSVWDEQRNRIPSGIGDYIEGRARTKLELAQEGKRMFSLAKNCLKDEMRPLHKISNPKTRLFVSFPRETTLVFRKLFGKFTAGFIKNRQNLYHSVGINRTSSEWKELYDHMSTHPNCIDEDFEAFDKRELREVVMLAGWIVSDVMSDLCGYTSEFSKIVATIWKDITETLCVSYDTVFMKQSGNPSGCGMTTLLNVLVNTIYHVYAFSKTTGYTSLAAFDEHVGFECFGDDVVQCISNEAFPMYNFESIKSSLKALGQVVTPGDKDATTMARKTAIDARYLKCGFKIDTEYPDVVYSTLEKDSIMSAFNYSSLEDGDTNGWVELLDRALIEAMCNGESFYKWFVGRLIQKSSEYEFRNTYPVLSLAFITKLSVSFKYTREKFLVNYFGTKDYSTMKNSQKLTDSKENRLSMEAYTIAHSENRNYNDVYVEYIKVKNERKIPLFRVDTQNPVQDKSSDLTINQYHMIISQYDNEKTITLETIKATKLDCKIDLVYTLTQILRQLTKGDVDSVGGSDMFQSGFGASLPITINVDENSTRYIIGDFEKFAMENKLEVKIDNLYADVLDIYVFNEHGVNIMKVSGRAKYFSRMRKTIVGILECVPDIFDVWGEFELQSGPMIPQDNPLQPQIKMSTNGVPNMAANMTYNTKSVNYYARKPMYHSTLSIPMSAEAGFVIARYSPTTLANNYMRAALIGHTRGFGPIGISARLISNSTITGSVLVGQTLAGVQAPTINDLEMKEHVELSLTGTNSTAEFIMTPYLVSGLKPSFDIVDGMIKDELLSPCRYPQLVFMVKTPTTSAFPNDSLVATIEIASYLHETFEMYCDSVPTFTQSLSNDTDDIVLNRFDVVTDGAFELDEYVSLANHVINIRTTHVATTEPYLTDGKTIVVGQLVPSKDKTTLVSGTVTYNYVDSGPRPGTFIHSVWNALYNMVSYKIDSTGEEIIINPEIVDLTVITDARSESWVSFDQVGTGVPLEMKYKMIIGERFGSHSDIDYITSNYIYVDEVGLFPLTMLSVADISRRDPTWGTPGKEEYEGSTTHSLAPINVYDKIIYKNFSDIKVLTKNKLPTNAVRLEYTNQNFTITSTVAKSLAPTIPTNYLAQEMFSRFGSQNMQFDLFSTNFGTFMMRGYYIFGQVTKLPSVVVGLSSEQAYVRFGEGEVTIKNIRPMQDIFIGKSSAGYVGESRIADDPVSLRDYDISKIKKERLIKGQLFGNTAGGFALAGGSGLLNGLAQNWSEERKHGWNVENREDQQQFNMQQLAATFGHEKEMLAAQSEANKDLATHKQNLALMKSPSGQNKTRYLQFSSAGIEDLGDNTPVISTPQTAPQFDLKTGKKMLTTQDGNSETRHVDLKQNPGAVVSGDLADYQTKVGQKLSQINNFPSLAGIEMLKEQERSEGMTPQEGVNKIARSQAQRYGADPSIYGESSS